MRGPRDSPYPIGHQAGWVRAGPVRSGGHCHDSRRRKINLWCIMLLGRTPSGRAKERRPRPCTGPEPPQAIRCEMTTPDTTARTAKPKGRFRLPDPPEREPDDMTSAEHLSETGLHHHLKQFLGKPETTIVSAEKYVTAGPGGEMRYPDLLVAFAANPAGYRETNGYVVSQQGKPPDWVLEIASEGTVHIDVGDKREFYERLGIPEYWRFDPTPTGQWHGVRLAGDRLVDGRYEAVDIKELPDGSLRGYSLALGLYLRWERGEFAFHNPTTGRPIASLESERNRADSERAARLAAESRAESERAARLAAEEQLRELEARLSREDE